MCKFGFTDLRRGKDDFRGEYLANQFFILRLLAEDGVGMKQYLQLPAFILPAGHSVDKELCLDTLFAL
jgi:hypothetical protein